MKYIITYLIITSHGGPCPPPPPGTDRFGRLGYHGSYNLMNCIINDTSKMTKIFYIKDSAYSFYKDAIDESKKEGFVFEPISNVKIDSVKIKK